MTIDYKPQGVCSRLFRLELEGERIVEIQVMGGCEGNSKGVASLLRGMPAREAIERLRGIRCGGKETSCPDQLARALEQALEQEEEKPA